MKKRHHDECRICGEKEFELYLESQDFFLSKEPFDIVKCLNCGFVFTRDIISEKDIGKYYKSQDYVSHSDTKEGLINRLYHVARNYMLGSKARIIGKMSSVKRGNLLDIGSGTGYFLKYMADSGWNVNGIEQDADARNFSIKNFGLEVNDPGVLSSIENQKYDVITMWHVLEHVLPLNEYLANIHDKLKDNGRFLVAVPNYLSFDGQHYGKYWAAYDVPRHLWHFSGETLTRLLDKHRFEIMAIRKMPFDSFYISLVSENYKGSRLALINGFTIGMISFVLSLFDSKRASSVLYIIRKKPGI